VVLFHRKVSHPTIDQVVGRMGEAPSSQDRGSSRWRQQEIAAGRKHARERWVLERWGHMDGGGGCEMCNLHIIYQHHRATEHREHDDELDDEVGM
jgi:hypothetical protein